MLTGLHFPFRFDPELLRRDLAVALTAGWTPHYNERDYGGAWSGIALRSATGESNHLIAGSADNRIFTDTPLLARCPYFQYVISVFECPIKSARLLSLAPQSFIREHSDHALGYDDGEIRIHIPIQTNPDVEFYVAGERLTLEEGHSYFINVNLPHRVNNRGKMERIHLVIDAEVNAWVHHLFRKGVAEGWDVPRSALPPRNVDDFRRRVLAEPALRQKLLAIDDPGRFADTVTRLGRELGFDFHDGDIGAASRCAPLQASHNTGIPGPGWMPVRVSFRDSKPFAEWIYTGSTRFTEPFFESSVKIALRSPFARFFRCEMPLEIMRETELAGRNTDPAGFIFHTSRCGSTLISRMLAEPAENLAISEAPPLDHVIQANHVQWLRWIVRALGYSAAETGKYFIKMDAWHIHSLPLIRAAFPDTPWIFVHRDPLEVMVSQLARPGLLSMPGAVEPGIFGMEPADITGLSREEWCARVLAGILRAALAARSDPRALFVDYRDLPDAVFGAIARHFELSLSGDDRIRMREIASFDAKNPGLGFQPDSGDKQAQATPLVRELSGAHLDPLHKQLIF